MNKTKFKIMVAVTSAALVLSAAVVFGIIYNQAGFFFDTFNDKTSGIGFISNTGNTINGSIKFKDNSLHGITYNSEIKFKENGYSGDSVIIDSSGIRMGTILTASQQSDLPFGKVMLSSSTLGLFSHYGTWDYSIWWFNCCMGTQVFGGLQPNNQINTNVYLMKHNYKTAGVSAYGASPWNKWDSTPSSPYNYAAPIMTNKLWSEPFSNATFAAGSWHNGVESDKLSFRTVTTGGINASGQVSKTAYSIYSRKKYSGDGSASTEKLEFTTDTDIPITLYGHSLNILSDVQIIFGGHNGSNYSSITYLKEAAGLNWQTLSLASNPSKRYFHATATMSDPWNSTTGAKSIYLFGGYGPDGDQNDLWRFDLASRKWNILAPLGDIPPARCGHALAAWRDRLLLFGGMATNPDGSAKYYNDLWEYIIAENKWYKISDNAQISPRAFFSYTSYLNKDLTYIGDERWGNDTNNVITSGDPKILAMFGGYNGAIQHPIHENLSMINGNNMLSEVWHLKPPVSLPYTASYYSPIIAMPDTETGQPDYSAIKNLSWTQSLPTGTSIEIKIAGSATNEANPSNWSFGSDIYSSPDQGNITKDITQNDINLFKQNKAKYFRFNITLKSNSTDTPVLSQISFNYFSQRVVVKSMLIEPNWNGEDAARVWDKVKFNVTLGQSQEAVITVLKADGSSFSPSIKKTITAPGTTTEVINISSINPINYPKIIIQADLTRSAPDDTLALSEWSLSWAQANAGDDMTVTANSPVTLNGNKSIGDALVPGGEDLEYKWVFGDGAESEWDTTESATHSYISIGQRTVMLSIRRPGGSVICTDTISVNVVANFNFTNNGSQIDIPKSGSGVIGTFEAFSTNPTDKFSQIKVPVITNPDYLDSVEVRIKGGGRIGVSSAIEAGYATIPMGTQLLRSDPQVTYEIRANVKGDAVAGQSIEFGTIGAEDITSDLPSECIVSTTPQFSKINIVKNYPNITIEAEAIPGSVVYMDGSSPYFPLLKFRGYTSGPLASLTRINGIKPYDMSGNLNATNVSSLEIVEMVQGINTYADFVSNYKTGNYVSLGGSTGFDGVNPATIIFSDKKPVFSGSVEKEYFIVAHIASTATPGEKVGVTLNPSSGTWLNNVFFFDDIGTLLTPSVGDLLPQNSVEISISRVDVNVAPSDTAVTPVYQGVKDQRIIDLSIDTLQGDAVIPWKNLLVKSIKVTKEETLTSGTSAADKVTLQYDKTGTGTVWENVGSGVFVGSNAIINTDFSAIEAAIYPYINKMTKKFRILVDVNSTAIGTVKFTIKGSEFTYTTNVNTVKTSFIGCTSSEQFSTKNITIQLAINKVSIDEVKDVGQAAIEQDKELVVMGLILRKTDTNPGGGAFNSLTIWPNNASGQSTYDLLDVEYKVYKVDTYDDYRGDSINDKCHAISNAYKFADRSNPQTIILNETQTIDDTYYYFVTAKVNRLAKFESTPELIDSKLRVSILNKGAVGLADNNDQVETSLSFPRNLSDIRITDRPDTMSVSPVKISNIETEARQGKKFAIAKLNLRTDEDYALWKSLTIQKGGSLPTNLITTAAIYLDADNNGVFNETRDQIMAQTNTFSGISATIGFGNYEMITDMTENKTYFVVLGIDNSSDAVGKTITVSIAANTSIGVLGIDNVVLEQTPFVSDEFTVIERYVPTRPLIKNIDYDNYTSDFQKIVFEWESSAEEGISEVKYLFSRTKVDDPTTITSWKALSKTASPAISSGKETITVIDVLGSNLDQNQTYYLYVQTVSEVDGIKYVSLIASEHAIKADITPPSRIAKPMIFTETTSSQVNAGSITTSGFYTVHWYPSTDEQTPIIFYEIQERDNENAGWRTITKNDPDSINFDTQHGTYTINITKTDSFKTYYYRVRSQNAAGLWSDWSEESVNVIVGAVTSVIAGDPTNYPNPFDSRNGSTKINFSVGAIGNYDGDIKIFDMYGRLVKKINFNGIGPKTEEIEWNGKNGAGAKVSKGVYIAAITVNADSGKTQKKIRKVGVIH